MKKIFLFMLLLLLLFISPVYAKEKVNFNACVDGDTFKITLDGKGVTVRMLAVDTPETVKTSSPVEFYGKEASTFTCNMVKNSKTLELEYDPNSDKKDKYGRLLAWVYVDNKLLQELIIDGGYGKVAYLYGKYLYTEDLQNSEIIAKEKRVGIWDDALRSKWEKENNKDDNEKLTTRDIFIGIGATIILLILGYIKKKLKKLKRKYKI